VRRALLLLALGTACTASARARMSVDAGPEEPAGDAAVIVDAPVRDAAVAESAAIETASLDSAAGGLVDLAAPDGPGDAAVEDAAPPPQDGADASPFATQLLLAVGNDGKRMVSLNGKIWMDEQRDTLGNRDGPTNLLAVAYGGGRVVAVGGGCVPTCAGRIVTFDGKDWHEVDASAATGRLTAVAYGNGAWVAVGSMPPALHSLDGGMTWAPAAKVAVPAGLRALAYGTVGTQPMFVAVGDGYTRVSSPDGITWSHLHASDGTNAAYRAVAIGNGVVVAAGGRPDSGKIDSGHLVRSLDGATWTDEMVGGPEMPSVVFADGKFFAFSGAGDDILQLSADGKEWLMQTTNGAGSNVAVGNLGVARFFLSRVAPSTIKFSTDGYTWGLSLRSSMPGDAILNAFVIAGP
jgi:hypothetical protein